MPELLDRLKTALADRYAIEREIGSGGMATVYVAEDLKHRRQVAIKVLRPELAAAVGPERFLREIEIAANLTHPHVLPLHDSGEADGFLYYVMPYVEGESLRDRLNREKQLPIDDALQITREVATALSYAHSHEVVHRDIKPENILLAAGTAVVADFGIAKAVMAAGGERLTETGMAVGTPQYMSPEQGVGSGELDGRSDIYSLGCVLYEMLGGEPPFTGPTVQSVVHQHMTANPAPVTQLRPSVPVEVGAAVDRSLAKTPADRWATASQFAGALGGAGTMASGVTPPVTVPRLQHPVRVAGLFGVGSLAVLGLVYILMLQLGLPDWVFLTASLLVAVALPITMATALLERQRATDGLPTPTSGPSRVIHRWLRWRNALRSGVVGFVALVMVTAVYMLMRSAGIGPAGTLVASGVIEEGAVVILSDFTDHTGDSALALTVTDAFAIDLAQSRTVRLMQPGDVRDALERMALDPGTRVDAEVAREIAIREGAGAVIVGDVHPAGAGYVLSARLLAPETGDVIEAFRETAKDPGELIAAIDGLSKQFRGRVGESLRSVRRSPPLVSVTTSSLEALRKYTQGARAGRQGDLVRALGLYGEAVAIDPTFANAYRMIATTLLGLGREPTRRRAAMIRAFELRDRLTQFSRAEVTSLYYYTVERDYERAASTLRSYYESHPEQWGVLNNLGWYYFAMRRWEEAESFFLVAIDSGAKGWSVYQSAREAQLALGKFEAAERSVDLMAERVPNNPVVAYNRAIVESARGDYTEARRHIEALREERSGDRSVQAVTSNFLWKLALVNGRLAEAELYLRDEMEVSAELGQAVYYIDGSIDLARISTWFRGEPVNRRQMVAAALRRYPLDSLPSADRPYLDLAHYYAQTMGRPDLARQMVSEYESEVDSGVRNTRLDQRHLLIAGMIAAAEGDAAEAIERFRSWDREIWCPICALPHLARAYDAAGEPDSVEAILERYLETPWSRIDWGSWSDVWELARAHRRLGELYEERGDRNRAIEQYNAFVELWKDADAELQPQVDDVRRRLAGLAGEASGRR